MEHELFHTYENDSMVINCYYDANEPDEAVSHYIVCDFKNGSESQTLHTNCRQACIALCVQVEDDINAQSYKQSEIRWKHTFQ